MKLKQCVILCGGLATRMYPLTKRLAKSMLPINGKPFIDYQLQLLKRHDIVNVVLCTSHLEWQIRDYVKNGEKWKLNVKYIYDKDQLGTGGALKRTEPYLLSNFLVWYGDSYCNTALQKLNKETSNRVIVFKNNNKIDLSKIQIVGNKVVKYSKEGCGEYIDVFYCFNKDIIPLLPDVGDISVAMQKLIRQKKLYAFPIKDRFYEIGKRKGYNEFRRSLGDLS